MPGRRGSTRIRLTDHCAHCRGAGSRRVRHPGIDSLATVQGMPRADQVGREARRIRRGRARGVVRFSRERLRVDHRSRGAIRCERRVGTARSHGSRPGRRRFAVRARRAVGRAGVRRASASGARRARRRACPAGSTSGSRRGSPGKPYADYGVKKKGGLCTTSSFSCSRTASRPNSRTTASGSRRSSPPPGSRIRTSARRCTGWPACCAPRRRGGVPACPTRGQAFRAFAPRELAKLDVECRGFLLTLEHSGILTPQTRELVIERSLAAVGRDADARAAQTHRADGALEPANPDQPAHRRGLVHRDARATAELEHLAHASSDSRTACRSGG